MIIYPELLSIMICYLHPMILNVSFVKKMQPSKPLDDRKISTGGAATHQDTISTNTRVNPCFILPTD